MMKNLHLGLHKEQSTLKYKNKLISKIINFGAKNVGWNGLSENKHLKNWFAVRMNMKLFQINPLMPNRYNCTHVIFYF